MTLKEVGIVIGKKLEVCRRPLKSSPIMASFVQTEVKRDGLLYGLYGSGFTALAAKKSYCKQIAGQLLVMDAMLGTRKEIQLPKKITVI